MMYVKCCQCVISRNRHSSINFKESCYNYLTQPMCLRLLRERVNIYAGFIYRI